MHDKVIVLECNLDDISAEELGYALERLLSEGALDAWFTPIYMKKNRPGTLLSALTRPDDVSRLIALIMAETTTLGVRYREYDRQIARRTTDIVMTPWGPVRRKLKWIGNDVAGVKPEYDDCSRIARDRGIPLHQVIESAKAHPPVTDQ